MKRDLKLFYKDILGSIDLINRYIGKRDYFIFRKDIKLVDSVVRRIEIIGEAITHIPKLVRKKYSEIYWDDFINSRNFLAHVYFGVNHLRLWNFVKKDLPKLKEVVERMLEEKDGEN